MQRRRKPRFLPCKISIQPSPRTLKHRRSRTICRTHRRHPTGTRNRIGTYDILRILFEQRGAKVLLSLKPKPCQTAAISGKQNLAQRRSKRRRDHQRLLSKLRTIIPRIVQTTPIDPKVTQGSRRATPQLPHDPKVPAGGRRNAPQLPAAPHSPPKAAGAKRRGRRRNQGPQQPRPPHISPAAPTNNGPIADRSQQRHRRRGPGLVFRTLRRPVWRLVRGSEGAGQGATHGRGRSEN